MRLSVRSLFGPRALQPALLYLESRLRRSLLLFLLLLLGLCGETLEPVELPSFDIGGGGIV